MSGWMSVSEKAGSALVLFHKTLQVYRVNWLAADGSQGHDVQVIASRLDINGVNLFTRIDEPLEGSCPNQTD